MHIVVAEGPLAKFSTEQLERLRTCAAPQDVIFSSGADPARLADAEIAFGLIQPATLQHGQQLRWIHTIGTAIDDLTEELRGRAVLITGERGSSRAYLAEHAFALLLALTRGIAIKKPET